MSLPAKIMWGAPSDYDDAVFGDFELDADGAGSWQRGRSDADCGADTAAAGSGCY